MERTKSDNSSFKPILSPLCLHHLTFSMVSPVTRISLIPSPITVSLESVGKGYYTVLHLQSSLTWDLKSANNAESHMEQKRWIWFSKINSSSYCFFLLFHSIVKTVPKFTIPDKVVCQQDTPPWHSKSFCISEHILTFTNPIIVGYIPWLCQDFPTRTHKNHWDSIHNTEARSSFYFLHIPIKSTASNILAAEI